MESTPKVYRTLIFVRHGQYQKDPEVLTPLGRRQAQLAGRALKHVETNKIFSSTMPRAQETASFIAKILKADVVQKAFFSEGALPPIGTYFDAEKPLNEEDYEKLDQRLNRNFKRADTAFEFLFRPPRKGPTQQIIVAHGNVIRHWVCRALGIDPATWVKMDIIQGSLTTITVDATGKMMLLGLSDVGHIPVLDRTYI